MQRYRKRWRGLHPAITVRNVHRRVKVKVYVLLISPSSCANNVITCPSSFPLPFNGLVKGQDLLHCQQECIKLAAALQACLMLKLNSRS